jgi:membrane protease YdiL (CAAX protease family)
MFIPEERISPSRRAQLVEVVILLLLLAPSLVPIRTGLAVMNVNFVVLATSVMVRDLALLFLVLYFVWRNGEGLEALGWKFAGRGSDVVSGIVLYVPITIGASLLDQALRDLGLSAPSHPPSALIPGNGIAELLLAAVLVVIVALSEESIFRGFLLLRFQTLTGSTVAAVLISSVIFSLGHGYEGTAGVITVGVLGVFLALIYLWRQNLVAPMVIHFLQDFVSIVVVSLLGLKSH